MTSGGTRAAMAEADEIVREHCARFDTATAGGELCKVLPEGLGAVVAGWPLS